jgi:hypothetical protein
MGNNGINYNHEISVDIRTDLVNMVKQYYPDIFGDFNDASVGMMILELNAAVICYQSILIGCFKKHK